MALYLDQGKGAGEAPWWLYMDCETDLSVSQEENPDREDHVYDLLRDMLFHVQLDADWHVKHRRLPVYHKLIARR